LIDGNCGLLEIAALGRDDTTFLGTGMGVAIEKGALLSGNGGAGHVLRA